MNLNSDQIKSILTIAKALQVNYDLLGVASTQNVRNPYPLHKLIIGVLPTRRSMRMTAKEIQDKLKSFGYRVPFLSLRQTLSNMSSPRRRAIFSADATVAQHTSSGGGTRGRRMAAYWYPGGHVRA